MFPDTALGIVCGALLHKVATITISGSRSIGLAHERWLPHGMKRHTDAMTHDLRRAVLGWEKTMHACMVRLAWPSTMFGTAKHTK